MTEIQKKYRLNFAKKSTRFVYSGALVFLIAFGGCHQKEKKKKSCCEVRLAVDSPLRSLHPHIGVDCPATHALRMIYEGLLRRGEDRQIVAGVATHYTVSKDRCRYTFFLRQSYWSNGDLLTAYDFERTWKEAVTPGSTHWGSSVFSVIRHAAACIRGEAEVDEVGVRAVDAYTLVVDLEHPAPYFPSLVASTMYAPVHTSARAGGPMVVNGPFYVKSWKGGQKLTLQKNRWYWDVAAVKLDKLHFYVIPDPMAQFYLYEQGELDYIGDPLTPLPCDVLKKRGVKSDLLFAPSATVSWIFVNTEVFPFHHPRLRRALMLALDRKLLTQHIAQLGEIPTTRLLKLDSVGLSFGSVEQKRDQARALFEEALADLGVSRAELSPLTISHRASLWATRLMQAVQQQWQEVLGWEVKLEASDWTSHVGKVIQGRYELAEMRWIFWYDDPMHVLQSFGNKEVEVNVSRWESDEYCQVIASADWELDREKRRRELIKAEKLLIEEAPVIPLYFNHIAYLKSPRLKGVMLSPCHDIDFKHAYVEPVD